jgi:hypothetical protein
VEFSKEAYAYRIILDLAWLDGFPKSGGFAKKNTIVWTPNRISRNVLVGTVSSMQISFASKERLSSVRVRVNGKLDGFVTASPSSFDAVPAGVPQTLTLSFNVPKGTRPREIKGSIRIVSAEDEEGNQEGDSDGENLKDTLPIIVEPTAATATIVPSSLAQPSADRVVVDSQSAQVVFVKDEVDVYFRPGTPLSSIRALVAGLGGVFLGSIPSINFYQVQVPQEGFAQLTTIADRLSQDPSIILALPHYLTPHNGIPTDPGSGQSYVLPLLSLPAAWDLTIGRKTVGPQDSTELGIGVIDSAFASDLVDLRDNVATPPANNPGATLSHGTKVASIIAAQGNNGLGIAGVMWRASLHLYSVGTSDGANHFDDVLVDQALLQSILDGQRVVNLSLSTSCLHNPCEPHELRALLDKSNNYKFFFDYAKSLSVDVLWVCSAGNEGTNVQFAAPARLSATYDNVVSVSAVDSQKRIASFSNYGQAISVGAPGISVPALEPNGSVGSFAATSASAPYVTGVAGLMLSLNPELSAASLKSIIQNTSDPTGNVDREGNEVRVLNAFRAVQRAQSEFSIAANPITQTVSAGNSISYTVTTTTTSATPQPINLSVSGFPLGVTGTFTPTSVTAGNSSVLTISASSSAPSNQGVLTIVGISGSVSHSTRVDLAVQAVTSMISTRATLDGSPFSGTINYDIVGPNGVLIGNSVPADTSGLLPGTYSLIYHSGGPSNSYLAAVAPADTQVLTGGSTITFTLRFLTLGGTLTPTLFYDRPSPNPPFGEPVIDSQGRLLVVSFASGSPPGFSGAALDSISPAGALNWEVPIHLEDYGAQVGSKTVVIGPNNRVYFANGTTLSAFGANGVAISGWPISINTGFLFGPLLSRDNGVIVDNASGTVFAKVGADFAPRGFGFPSTILAFDPNGNQLWQSSGSGGNTFGLVRGPSNDIYSLLDNSFVRLGRSTGSQLCQVPAQSTVGSFVGGTEGAFTSLGSTITAFDGNCNATPLITSAKGNLEVRRYDQGVIFGIEYPVPFDLSQTRLLAVSNTGTLLWRDSRVLVPKAGNPIRAIRQGVLYVLGQDTSDGNKAKLFLIGAQTGQILNSVETAFLCSSCGVAVAPNGMVYVNDLDSNKIYRLQ